MIKFKLKTLFLLTKAKEILSSFSPMTVRQLYYRLVSKKLIENNQKSYKSLVKTLTNARREGLLSYDDFEDRTRTADKQSSWTGVTNFMEAVKISYKRSANDSQSNYVEVWLEKDALANLFEPITDKYNLYLIVGRGYNSASALNEAGKRLRKESRPITILYFGDFDPSGEDIYRDIEHRLSEDFGVRASFRKVSLTREDISKYNLPPNKTKVTDSRQAKFVEKHGDLSVELDALPPDVLRDTIEVSILSMIDKGIWENEIEKEKEDRIKINSLINSLEA